MTDAADHTDVATVRRISTEVAADLTPVKGIFHADS